MKKLENREQIAATMKEIKSWVRCIHDGRTISYSVCRMKDIGANCDNCFLPNYNIKCKERGDIAYFFQDHILEHIRRETRAFAFCIRCNFFATEIIDRLNFILPKEYQLSYYRERIWKKINGFRKQNQFKG